MKKRTTPYYRPVQMKSDSFFRSSVRQPPWTFRIIQLLELHWSKFKSKSTYLEPPWTSVSSYFCLWPFPGSLSASNLSTSSEITKAIPEAKSHFQISNHVSPSIETPQRTRHPPDTELSFGAGHSSSWSVSPSTEQPILLWTQKL